MLRTGKQLITLFVLLCLSACEKSPAEFNHSSLHFGSTIDITLYDVSPELAEQAFAKLDEDFAYLHAAWSPREAGSLRRTNALIETGKTFTAGPSILPLIKKSQQLSRQSEQLFNPSIGKLINLWQFHKHDRPGIKPPEHSAIQTLLNENPQLDDLHIDGIKMRSNNTSVSLNFGSFAKGYAMNLEMQQLKNMGIHNATINSGGNLKTTGSHGAHPWVITIKHPRLKTWLARIETHKEESVFTSGDYERFYLYKGKRYHHIIDPRTGYPAAGTQSVSVLHTDSALADAAATALFIAGPAHWQSIAKKLNLTSVMLIDSSGAIHLTPDMRDRLVFNPQIEATINITAPL